MSRGPGKWQRGILAALRHHPAVYVSDLLPSDRTKAEYSAVHRAAYTLAANGKVQLWRPGCYAGAEPKIIVARLGMNVVRERVPRLSVDRVPGAHLFNT